LLVVNLLAVGVYLLRRAQQQEPAPAVAAGAAPATNASAGGATSSQPAAPVPNPTLSPTASSAAQSPALTQSAEPAAPRRAVNESAARNPLAEEVGVAESGYDASLQSAAAAVPAGPPAVARNGGATKRGTVVYAPIPEAGDLPYDAPPVETPAVRAAPAPAPAVTPSSEVLPGADELTARGGLPALHLDLHVYATQPQQRFMFVNSRKYREGETLAEGPLVEQITADGAVLSFRGSRFKLTNK
jgi:general secretion pathway protein B